MAAPQVFQLELLVCSDVKHVTLDVVMETSGPDADDILLLDKEDFESLPTNVESGVLLC